MSQRFPTHDGTQCPTYRQLAADMVHEVRWKTPDGVEHTALLSGGRVYGDQVVLESQDGEKYGLWLFERPPQKYPIEYITAEGRAELPGAAAVPPAEPVYDGTNPAPWRWVAGDESDVGRWSLLDGTGAYLIRGARSGRDQPEPRVRALTEAAPQLFDLIFGNTAYCATPTAPTCCWTPELGVCHEHRKAALLAQIEERSRG